MRPPPEAPPPDVSELLSADGQQDQQVAMGGDAQPCGSSSGAEAADSESAPLAPSATPAAARSADHRGEGGGGSNGDALPSSAAASQAAPVGTPIASRPGAATRERRSATSKLSREGHAAPEATEGAAPMEVDKTVCDGGVAAVKKEGRTSPRAPPSHRRAISENPSTPVGSLMKTPEIEALVQAAMHSPLSEFASLLEMTPKIPGHGAAQPGQQACSPLWQLASLMEKTPRLPTQGRSRGVNDPPSDPEALGQALLTSSLAPSPDSDTPDQLRRDLAHALQQAISLSSPGKMPISSYRRNMPPPALPEEHAKARKRKLEEALNTNAINASMMARGGGTPPGMPSLHGGTVGMFDHFYADEAHVDSIPVADLLDGDSLGLGMGGRRKGGGKGRSKGRDKKKGKPNRCRCDRSGCLKRYCVCFAAGNLCEPGECKCKDCKNDDATEEHRQERMRAVIEMQKKKNNAFTPRIGGDEGGDIVHQVGCNCKRSGCLKRYCECFQGGVKCTDKCKCVNCKNPYGANPDSRPTPPTVSAPVGADDNDAPAKILPPVGSPLKFGGTAVHDCAPSPTAYVSETLLDVAAVAAAAAAADDTEQEERSTKLGAPEGVAPLLAASPSAAHPVPLPVSSQAVSFASPDMQPLPIPPQEQSKLSGMEARRISLGAASPRGLRQATTPRGGSPLAPGRGARLSLVAKETLVSHVDMPLSHELELAAPASPSPCDTEATALRPSPLPERVLESARKANPQAKQPLRPLAGAPAGVEPGEGLEARTDACHAAQ